MKNIFIISIVLISFFIFIEGLVHALSLGTLVDKYYIETNKKNTVEFIVKLWNVEKKPLSISFNVLQNDGKLPIFITPNNFILNYSGYSLNERGVEYVNSDFGLMKITPVRIIVNIPSSIKYNDYTIMVGVTGGNPTSGVSATLESKFRFVVNVTPYAPRRVTPSEISTTSKETPQWITGLHIFASENPYVFPIASAVIVILVISLLIYKYA